MLGKVDIEPLQFFRRHLGDQTPQRHDLGFGGCLLERNKATLRGTQESRLTFRGQPATSYRSQIPDPIPITTHSLTPQTGDIIGQCPKQGNPSSCKQRGDGVGRAELQPEGWKDRTGGQSTESSLREGRGLGLQLGAGSGSVGKEPPHCEA